MIIKISSLCMAVALALPVAAMADARPINGGALRANAPPSQGKTHHKVPCCSGRMQAQPRPAH